MNFLSSNTSTSSFPSKSSFMSLLTGNSKIQRLAQTLLLPKFIITLQKSAISEPKNQSDSDYAFTDVESSDSEQIDNQPLASVKNSSSVEKDVSTPSQDYVHPNPVVTICLTTADEAKGRSILSCFRQLSCNNPAHDSKLKEKTNANFSEQRLQYFGNIEQQENLTENQTTNSQACKYNIQLLDNLNKTNLIQEFTYKVEDKSGNSCGLTKKIEQNIVSTGYSSEQYVLIPRANEFEQLNNKQNVYEIKQVQSMPNIKTKVSCSKSDQFSSENNIRIAKLEKKVEKLHKELAYVRGNIEPSLQLDCYKQLNNNLRKVSIILGELKMSRSRRSTAWLGPKHRECGGGHNSQPTNSNIYYYLPKIKNNMSSPKVSRNSAGSERKTESQSGNSEKNYCNSKDKEVWKSPKKKSCYQEISSISDFSSKSSLQSKYLLQSSPLCQAGKCVLNSKKDNGACALKWLPENDLRRDIYLNNFEEISVNKPKESEKTKENYKCNRVGSCNEILCLVDENDGRAVCNYTPEKPIASTQQSNGNQVLCMVDEKSGRAVCNYSKKSVKRQSKTSEVEPDSNLKYKIEDIKNTQGLVKAKSSRHLIREHEGSHKMHFTEKQLTAQPSILDLSHGHHIKKPEHHPILKNAEDHSSEDNNSEYVYSEWKNQAHLTNVNNSPKQKTIDEVKSKSNKNPINSGGNSKLSSPSKYIKSLKDKNRNIDRKRNRRQGGTYPRNNNGICGTVEGDDNDELIAEDNNNQKTDHLINNISNENINHHGSGSRQGSTKKSQQKAQHYKDNGPRVYAKMLDNSNAIPIHNNYDSKYVTQDSIQRHAEKLSLSTQTENSHLLQKRSYRSTNQKCCCDPQMLVENIHLNDNENTYIENKSMTPLIVCDLDELIRKFTKNENPNKIMLTIQIQRNNLYHIDIGLVGNKLIESQSIGCLYATECAVAEAISRKQLDKYLTFFVVNSHNTSKQKYRILSQSFVCMKRNV